MRRYDELEEEEQRAVEAQALAEIRHFQAGGDPVAIERLAAYGRQVEGPADAVELASCVSDAMEDMAAELRNRQRQFAAALGSMGSLVRLSIRV